MKKDELIRKICSIRAVRTFVAKRSFKWFFALYFGDYIKKKTAPFHEEIISMIQEENNETVVIMGFRGSGKSSIITCAGVIWNVVTGRKKFVTIFSRTQELAKGHLQNICSQLENNELLLNDFGPFKIGNYEWSAYALELPKYKAKIMGISCEQATRGSRFNENRPQLIILDDVDDNASVSSLEMREKNYEWFTREIVPLKQEDTKIIIVGTPIHNDSLIMRIQKLILEEKMSGRFKSYPIVDENGVIAWPAMYPDMAAINKLKLDIGNERAFFQEYLLQIISDQKSIINWQDIKKYSRIRENANQHRYVLIGIDPAISQSNYADFSAIVPVDVYVDSKNQLKIYILPNIVNSKISFSEQVQSLKQMQKIYSGRNGEKNCKVIVETVGYQEVLFQQLNHEGVVAEAYRVTDDKRVRLNVLQKSIQDGTIVFPEVGAEQLIDQIVNFGSCQHDDLVDAFSMVCNLAIADHASTSEPWFYIIEGRD